MSWYSKNLEKGRAYAKAYKKKNPEYLKRHKGYWKNRYATDRKYKKKRKKDARAWTYANKYLWLKEYKAKKGCKFCRERNPICLEFHHKDPKKKEFTISKVKTTKNKENILLEIKKCIILCSNCHKKEHERLLKK